MTHCAKRYKNSVDKKSEHFFEKRSNIKELTIHKINEVIESMKYYHRDSRVNHGYFITFSSTSTQIFFQMIFPIFYVLHILYENDDIE